MSILEQLGIPWILAGLLLIPYLCWGVYLLKMRFQRQAELSVTGEAFTFMGLVLFLIVEFAMLNMWLSDSPLIFIISILGLLVSVLALYGPMLMSLGSHVLVDAVMPSGAPVSHTPKYGAAEGFEQKGDFEAAAREYMAIARMFPREAKAALRAGDNLSKVGRPDEAVTWLERGLHCTDDSEECLRVVNRIAETYLRHLDRPDDAKRTLQEYLERFPDAEYAGSVKRRLERMGVRPDVSPPADARQEADEEGPPFLPEGPSYLPED